MPLGRRWTNAIYVAHRKYIEHEDHLMNYRMTWFLGIESAAFAAFGLLLLDSKPKGSLDQLTIDRCAAAGDFIGLFLLAIVGAALAVVFGLSLLAATRSVANLYKDWEVFRAATGPSLWQNSNAWEFANKLPRIAGAGKPTIMGLGHLPVYILPGTAWVVWVFLIIVGFGLLAAIRMSAALASVSPGCMSP